MLDKRATRHASHKHAFLKFNNNSSNNNDDVHVVMPEHIQEGVREDIAELELDEVVRFDSVYNHELSWLSFNWRVLALAMHPNLPGSRGTTVPLYERLRFVAISACNLDEFFAKRVGGLKRQEVASSVSALKAEAYQSWPAAKQLNLIAAEVERMVDAQSSMLTDTLLPELREKGLLSICRYDELSTAEQTRLDEYFASELEVLLTPIALDPAHPFPQLQTLSLSLAVQLRNPEDQAKGGADTALRVAIVPLPPNLARWIDVDIEGKTEGKNWTCVTPLEEIVRANLDSLFGGMQVVSTHLFRVTRNAELERHEEEAEDLLDMISEEMRERRFAPFVRMEIEEGMPTFIRRHLMRELSLKDTDIFEMDVPVLDLSSIMSLPVGHKVASGGYAWPAWEGTTPGELQGAVEGRESFFGAIRRQDVLLHHPFHSFGNTVQRFVEAAADDDRVVAIKATLYRTSSDSPIISALIKAVAKGKQVAVLVELKARFDEERNVSFAQRLEDAGCAVAYGVIGLKTHAKLVQVVRRDGTGKLATYVHIGTGNYNPSTARVYTDFGLLSANQKIGADVTDVFKMLTGLHSQAAVGGYDELLVSPKYMIDAFVELIDREIEAAKEGKPCGVTVKVNSLDEPVLVRKIYEASLAGVKVNCIVRGVCRLRPGVPGLSDNVRVISIVGRFLEHHRVYSFMNRGDPLYYIGSADWMSRNLRRRVEVATPVHSEEAKTEIQRLLNSCLLDGVDAWEMRSDGRYERPQTIEANTRMSISADKTCDIFDPDQYVSIDFEDPYATTPMEADGVNAGRGVPAPECLSEQYGMQQSMCEYYARRSRVKKT
uniref:ATP-polyphosphate phosphotransferase n=1 Tax=Pycnococcus provasolii TaxID=41880 RepID=A0A7S2ALC2_9CHLO|mmetsp:Transcript_12666/g.28757  ORF Transcript_12666/g.28757 Transcript_12666/m.28757 type:complete len:829 (+) Transcript_12666:239-2725(+)